MPGLKLNQHLNLKNYMNSVKSTDSYTQHTLTLTNLSYLKNLFGQKDIDLKLSRGWNHATGAIPNWILREFISSWIQDCFDTGYSTEKYQHVPHKMCITTQDIFLDFST
jgi:hypothetical protein